MKIFGECATPKPRSNTRFKCNTTTPTQHHWHPNNMTTTPTAPLHPLWILSSSAVVIATVSIRRCCVRPGGLIHRQLKSQKPKRIADSKNDFQSDLLQFGGLLTIGMAFTVYFVAELIESSYAGILLGAIFVANGLDTVCPAPCGESSNSRRRPRPWHQTFQTEG